MTFRKSILTVSLWMLASLLLLPGLSSAAPKAFSKGIFEEESNIYRVNDQKVVAQVGNEVELIDLVQGKLVKTLSTDQKVLDISILNQPTKIIILTSTRTHKIQKHIFNDQGVELSQVQYPLTLPKDAQVKWSAPANKVNERLMVRQGNHFSLYESTGKAPILKFDAAVDKRIYEYMNIVDWDFENSPYLVIKYSGERTMAIDYMVKIFNLNNKQAIDVGNLELDTHLKINQQNRLELWNSYTYSDITPPNAVQPDPLKEQTFHALYSLETGKPLLSNQSKFDQVTGQPSGWETQVVGQYVFVQDLSTRAWSLYQSNGTLLADQKSGLEAEAKFLNYNSTNQTAYFLVSDGKSSALRLKPVKL